MSREHLDAVRQLEQPAERVEQALRAFSRRHGQVGAGRVADEERVAGEDEPRLGRARRVDHGEARVLGPVSGGVNRAEHDVAELDLRSILECVVLVRDLRGGVDADRNAVLEREPAVPGEVVGVRVRLDRPHDPDVVPLRLPRYCSIA